jgi:hypothetical protein
MKGIGVAFVAALALGIAAMSGGAPHAQARAATIQFEAQPAAAAADELSAGKRKWKRHGWHGKRKWKRHGWRGYRKWRGHRWYGRRYWRGGACFGNRGRCISVWRYGRRVIVCCR